MPSLVLFGRRTFFAGDDIRAATLIVFLFRFIQFTLSLPILIYLFNAHNRSEIIDNRDICFATAEDVSFAKEHALEILNFYAGLSLSMAIVGMIMCIPTYTISGRGTPTQTEPRRALAPLCYLNLTLLNLIRLVNFSVGLLSSSLLGDYCKCREYVLAQPTLDPSSLKLKEECLNDSAWLSIFIGLLVTHSMDAVFFGGTILYFGCKVLPSIRTILLSEQARWQCCCRCCFGITSCFTCCLYGGKQAVRGDFSDFALLMTNYFDDNGILDVTASDLLAGLLMLKRVNLQEEIESRNRFAKVMKKDLTSAQEELEEQRMSTVQTQTRPSMQNLAGDLNMARLTQSWAPGRSLSFRPKEDTTDISEMGREYPTRPLFAPVIRETLSEKNPYERYLLAEGARFICIAEAVYGNPVKSWQDALGLSKIFSSRSRTDLDLKLERISQVLTLWPVYGIKPEDIVYTQFKRGIAMTPYAIVVDHAWKSVIVTIRGSSSFEDVLADITLRPDELVDLGHECGFNGEGRYCHAGVLVCAEWIYRDLGRYVPLRVESIQLC
jgi:sn1-specific diacylglycerol lipase